MGSPKSDYGEAIDEEVVLFYNLFNPEDNVLEPNSANPFSPFQIYPSFEGDLALGQNGHQTFPIITLPKNYAQINVQDEIKNFSDADAIEGEDLGLCDAHNKHFCKIKNEGWDLGLCTPLPDSCKVDIGDNHAGYIGFRNLTGLVDDGAINEVVSNWRNS